MRDEIKKGLLDVTPDLQDSKSRVREAVLQFPQKQNSSSLMPRFVFGSFIVLLIIFITTTWQSDNYVQGFSEETLNMYGLLDDEDNSEQYRKDLTLVKYGELKGIEVSRQDVKKIIASYEAELPKSFDKVLKKNGITKSAYKEQFLTLKAHLQIVRESLIPHYEQMYPQFHQEILDQLLLFDAVEEVDAKGKNFGAVVNIRAVVLYEGENARILALMEEKRLIEEQLIFMPIRDKLTLKTGDEVLLGNSLLTSILTKSGVKQFAVTQDITKITTNKTTNIPAMPKKLNTLIKQMPLQNIPQTEEPDVQLITISGNYSVWYGNDIIIGSGDKGFIIRKEKLKEWGDEMIKKIKL